ncbi:LysR family transcriptional regulator [Gammaproteobacteria bacterium]|jgi:DNA-binding transcriptional LysR family regulator|nr:LysR family transcriptional regulator [Gammaproteobacteria bacterium]|tara:strand:- start:87 stop:992 length:906 start_codon:yes stop_codon:yes gene_type:complete
MISSRHIEVFYHVYNEGSLTRAAKILNVSQPLISKTLAYAEHKLKLKLFVRHARRLSPTPEADLLFKHAAAVNKEISKFNNIADNLVKNPSSTINIGCTPSLGLGLLPQLLNQYLKQGLGTKFNVVNLQSLDLEEQLKELTFDLIICFNPEDSELFQKTRLLQGSLVLIAPANNAPEGKTFKLSQIENQPFIKVKNLKTGSSKRNLDHYLDNAGVQVNWIAETETIQVAKAMVEQGAGYAIIDDFSAKVYGSRISVHRLEPKIQYDISMVNNKEKPLSVSAQKFIDFLSATKIEPSSFVID